MGAALAACMQPGDVVRLVGELGAGKTALVRGVASGLETLVQVSSTTFVVINVYPSQSDYIQELIHIDAYRVADPDELANVGWDHLFDPSTRAPRMKPVARAAVIEWPSRIEGALPELAQCATVTLSHAGTDDRHMVIELPESWRSRPGVHELLSRPPILCPVTQVWVAPTAKHYPFASKRAKDADLFRWL